MAIVLGPILGLSRSTKDSWDVSCLFMTDDGNPQSLQWRAAPSAAKQLDAGAAVLLFEAQGSKVFRHDWSVQRGDADVVVSYTLAGADAHEFVVPKKNEPPRMVYASCNGFSSQSAMKKVSDKNALWKGIKVQHENGRFHPRSMGRAQGTAEYPRER